jgi:Dolichyl-phosphate-mannose-protein mannosyltransferase
MQQLKNKVLGKDHKQKRSGSALIHASEKTRSLSAADSEVEVWEIGGCLTRWPSFRAYLCLAVATAACLIPFSSRAFHVDDTLFIWAAQQIQKHPLDPYGFQLVWDVTRVPMASVTENPPLSSYYAALVGTALGWSERALHCGFLLVAIALVLGSYRLAQNFTHSPFLAALATLMTPGVLVSAGSIMCDTMMLALWIWAAVFWIEGLRRSKISFPILSAMLIAASALTKYFGVSLIPLLFVYAVVRQKRLGVYVLYLFIPIAALAAYQIWTGELYGHGLLSSAAAFAASQRAATQGSSIAMAIIGLSFAGGCSLVGWTSALLIWPRAKILIATLAAAIAAVAVLMGWVGMGLQLGGGSAQRFHLLIGAQLFLCVAGGISLVSLAIRDFMKNRNADSLFLGLWALGTLAFAAFVNYTVNARSVLPLIPAAAILVARRLDELQRIERRDLGTYVALILLASGALSVWIAAGDASLANSARTAAMETYAKTRGKGGTVWFEGHWGFQYYMEMLGARPADFGNPQLAPGDYVVIPENNIQLQEIPPQYVASREELIFGQSVGATTISHELGAGFYSSYWGPLPYAIGPVPAERYWIIRLAMPDRPRQ